ncbi:hypothetical protein [endosymbiont of unidentified scaly snail isolate Monju]|uniref:hypothetical protein n=1 Tax=endosymbiont of unidentified scaly snail isolate Monju TaxID=1248727 RepID=UPI0003892237|nr:hypothetical protein [endosymbiont of unidentified scaly snail isolate Monju]BAN69809.1 hypothetical protein EBS_1945 [endosymbiont of unidentified scaly snail isolate Monju]
MKWVKKILLRIFERKMPAMTQHDAQLAEEFRQALRVEMSSCSERVGAAQTWANFCRELKECVDVGDPREFLQWPVVRKSMFVSNPRWVAEEMRYLRSLPDWK